MYNIAYYGAVSSLERAMLTLKYRWPWFEWYGWRQWSTNTGNISDHRIANFWFLSQGNNGMKRSITSKNNWRIPALSGGNVDRDLITGDSINFNKLTYNTREEFFLTLDNESNPGNFFSWTNTTENANIYNISITIRLNPLIKNMFGSTFNGDLDENTDRDGDRVDDEIVVNRTFEWVDDQQNPFTIQPNIAVFFDKERGIVDRGRDTSIRQSHINNDNITQRVINATGSPFSPLEGWRSLTGHQSLISKNPNLKTMSLSNILSNTAFTDKKLSLSLVNLLTTKGGQIYPFLEYAIETNNTPIADRYYTIKGEATVWPYRVILMVKKPTSNTNKSADFTLIF